MTTAVAAPETAFVDTNILIYAAIPAFPWHGDAVARLSELEASAVTLSISRQTIREYLSALSKPSSFTPAIPTAALLPDIAALTARFTVVEDGPAVTAALITILTTVACGGKQVYDANIVATMIAHGIRKILTHNVGDFQRFSAWIEIVPLIASP
jgi:predicted nucleic acid-binding protein